MATWTPKQCCSNDESFTRPCVACIECAVQGEGTIALSAMVRWIKETTDELLAESLLNQVFYEVVKMNKTVHIKYLIENGADMNYKASKYAGDYENDRYSTLIYAVKHENIELINWLIGHGIYLNAIGFAEGDSSLFDDSICCHTVITSDNTEPTIRQCSSFMNPLMMAVEKNNLAIIKILMDAGANPNVICKDNGTALFKMVDKRKLEMIRLFLEYDNVNVDLGLDKEYGNVTPLWHVVRYYFNGELCKSSISKEIIDLLVAHGANVKQGVLVGLVIYLIGSCREESFDLHGEWLQSFERVLKAGADDTSQALFKICSSPISSKLGFMGLFGQVLNLCKKDINSKDLSRGYTPVMMVLCEVNEYDTFDENAVLEAVKLLYSHGSDLNATTGEGSWRQTIRTKEGDYECPLLFALSKSLLNVIRYLLENGADERLFMKCMEGFDKNLTQLDRADLDNRMNDEEMSDELIQKLKTRSECYRIMTLVQPSHKIQECKQILLQWNRYELIPDDKIKIKGNFDEISNVQSLTHECCCKVRGILIDGSVRRFKESVEELLIPDELKELLMFKNL